MKIVLVFFLFFLSLTVMAGDRLNTVNVVNGDISFSFGFDQQTQEVRLSLQNVGDEPIVFEDILGIWQFGAELVSDGVYQVPYGSGLYPLIVVNIASEDMQTVSGYMLTRYHRIESSTAYLGMYIELLPRVEFVKIIPLDRILGDIDLSRYPSVDLRNLVDKYISFVWRVSSAPLSENDREYIRWERGGNIERLSGEYRDINEANFVPMDLVIKAEWYRLESNVNRY